MLVHSMTRIRIPTGHNPLHFLLLPNPRHRKRLPFLQPGTMAAAAATQSKRKRPICPSCSKPTRTCLCNRIQTTPLENSIGVTILQHSLEKNHALNSTRIAKLGLKNLTVSTVFDVDLEARFVIECPDPKLGCFILTQQSKTLMNPQLDLSFCSTAAIDGFVVKKLNEEDEEEIEIRVPAGSILLYPSEKSMNIDEMKAKNIEVKNLIVLDGTWSKAKRMYVENPWLQYLPHLKLEMEEKLTSLYGEVRKQPKTGYFSTIESIVYALKGLGEEDTDKLDKILGVFELMVGDQRKCKEESLRKICRNQ